MDPRSIASLILSKNYDGLKQVLDSHPGLANQGLPYDEVNSTLAHPLHRLCDGVFAGKLTDDEAVKLAEIFLDHGASVDGVKIASPQDTPLVAAASLHADAVALLLIDRGANIHHAGCYGGTALHWAAWCGRPKVVERLVSEGAEIDRLCTEFRATPLFWAIHGLKNGGPGNRYHQEACARILVEAGASKTIPNGRGTRVIEMLSETDEELKALLR